MLADFFSSGTLIVICIFFGLFTWAKFMESRVFKAIISSTENDAARNDAELMSKKFFLVIKLRWLREKRDIFPPEIRGKIGSALIIYYLFFASTAALIIFAIGAYLFPVNQN